MMFETVRDVMVETLNCDMEAVTMDAQLMEDLGADSLEAVELSMALEEACGISIPDEAIPTFKTVGDIVRYLESQED